MAGLLTLSVLLSLCEPQFYSSYLHRHSFFARSDPGLFLTGPYISLKMCEEVWSGDEDVTSLPPTMPDVIQVHEGFPYTGLSTSTHPAQYVFSVNSEHTIPSIHLTAVSGEPVAYVTVDSQSINQGSSDFRVNVYESDVLTTNSIHFRRLCPHNCHLFLSIYTNDTATFTLRITATKPLVLAYNLPAAEELSLGRTRRYVAAVSTAAAAITDLQTLFGDISLSVTVADLRRAQSRRELNSEGVLRPSDLFLPVSFPRESLSQSCPSGVCLLSVRVACFSVRCRYTVAVRMREDIVLLEDATHLGVLRRNELQYFRLITAGLDRDVHISVSANTDSGLQLLALPMLSQPTDSLTDKWQADFSNGGLLRIPYAAFDPYSKSGIGLTVSVKATRETEYRLVISTKKTQAVELTPLLPARAEVKSGTTHSYSVYHYQDKGLSIAITVVFGDVSMTVTRVSPERTSDAYTWSLRDHNQQFLFIPVFDPHFCTRCRYLISIQGVSIESEYVLIVAAGEDVAGLASGVPAKNIVENGELKLYRIDWTERGDVDAAVVILDGKADLCLLNKLNHSEAVSIVSGPGPELLHIPRGSLSPDLILGIRGRSNCLFLITLSSGTVVLHPRWPALYRFTPGAQAEVAVFNGRATEGQTLLCHLQALSSYTDFIVKVTGFRPELVNTAYTRTDFDPVYGFLAFNLPKLSNDTAFKVSVSLGERSGTDKAFELTCREEGSVRQMWPGKTVFGEVTMREKFEVVVVERRSLSINLISCLGQANLSISRNSSLIHDPSLPMLNATLHSTAIETVLHSALGRYFVTVSNEHVGQWDEIAVFELEVGGGSGWGGRWGKTLGTRCVEHAGRRGKRDSGDKAHSDLQADPSHDALPDLETSTDPPASEAIEKDTLPTHIQSIKVDPPADIAKLNLSTCAVGCIEGGSLSESESESQSIPVPTNQTVSAQPEACEPIPTILLPPLYAVCPSTDESGLSAPQQSPPISIPSRFEGVVQSLFSDLLLNYPHFPADTTSPMALFLLGLGAGLGLCGCCLCCKCMKRTKGGVEELQAQGNQGGAEAPRTQ